MWGGVADSFYIPESVNELLDLLLELKKEHLYILSGGSNLLINDQKRYAHIIYMKSVDCSFENYGNGLFYIGASVRIQKVIKEVNEAGFGGFEELIGLPALFGGVVYMNAGIGGKEHPKFNISDFVLRVKVIDKSDWKIKWIDKADCDFDYRKSVFQLDGFIILGAEVQLDEQMPEISKEIIRKRHAVIKDSQEFLKGTFGSIFAESNRNVRNLVALTHKKKGGVCFGTKNTNWFLNDGNASFEDAIYLIHKCESMHKLFRQPISREVIVWE